VLSWLTSPSTPRTLNPETETLNPRPLSALNFHVFVGVLVSWGALYAVLSWLTALVARNADETIVDPPIVSRIFQELNQVLNQSGT